MNDPPAGDQESSLAAQLLKANEQLVLAMLRSQIEIEATARAEGRVAIPAPPGRSVRLPAAGLQRPIARPA